MVASHRTIAIIPARGGSKRIPNKNIKKVGALTLVEWAIKQAKASKLIDDIVVTSDSEFILQLAKTSGVYAISRPRHLSKDETSTDEVLLHAIECIQAWGWSPEFIVTLQPTSPLRPDGLIDECIGRFLAEYPKCKSLITVHQAGHFYWSQAGVRSWDSYPQWRQINAPGRPRSQDMRDDDKLWVENGAVYICPAYEMMYAKQRLIAPVTCFPIEAAHGWDIDTELDLLVAQALAKGGV